MQKNLIFPNRDAVTQVQIGSLLNVVSVAMAGLLNPAYAQMDVSRPATELPGEAKVALENTLILTCERIDEIIKDTSRWSIQAQNTLESNVEAIQKEHLELIKSQTEAVKNLDLPHMKYKPTLMRMDSGNWLAVLGDVEDLDNSLVGIGESPEEALHNFDEIFKGKLPKHIVKWLDERETAVEKEIPTPPYPKPPKDKK
jgi:hypothetical protein